MVAFHVAGIPQATPVRDDQTGIVVDGYRVTVVSNDTGARAILEIPAARMSKETVAELAEERLSALDGTLAAFPKPQSS